MTRHEKYDVMMPETDGERIVYIQDGYLQRLDVQERSEPKKSPLELPSDRWRLRNRWLNPKDYIHAMDVGNDGKTALLEARGDVFLLPAEGRADAQPDPDARVRARSIRAFPPTGSGCPFSRTRAATTSSTSARSRAANGSS